MLDYISILNREESVPLWVFDKYPAIRDIAPKRETTTKFDIREYNIPDDNLVVRIYQPLVKNEPSYI